MLELLAEVVDAVWPVVYGGLAAVTAGFSAVAGLHSLSTFGAGGPTMLAAWFAYMAVLALVACYKLGERAYNETAGAA